MADDEKTTDTDDEFSVLPEPPRRRSPLVAVAVIVLAGAVTWHLRDDVGYAFRSRTPQALGDARSLFARGVPLADDSYVELAGQPDRRNALFIEPRGEKSRLTFFRLLGTNSRVLVRATDTSSRTDLQDRWKGRLRRFDVLPYAPQMRKYYADEVQAARYLSPAALKEALAHPGVAVEARDRTGEPLKLEPDSLLTFEVAFPDELAALASKDKFASLADAKHEIERAGLTVTGGADGTGEYRVYVKAPDRNATIAKLEANDFGFALHDERLTNAWKELSLDGEQLHLGSRTVPFSSVQSASVEAPIRIGADAWLLVEGEAPADYWWAPLLVLMLVVFAGFNVWYLLRSRDSRPRHPAT